MVDTKVEPFLMTCDMEHYRAYGSERLLKSLDSLTSEIEGAKGEEDIEHVHRMRVASRRLRSALVLFGECFEEDGVKRWNKAVRSVTRELGTARDLDVQISFLKEFIDAHEGFPSLDAFKTELETQRTEIQPRMVSSLEKLERTGTLVEMKRKYEEIQGAPRCSVPYGTMERAFHHISNRLDDLLSLQDCVHRPDAKEKQHEMRIAAKRLRYTMEVFETLYGDPLKDRIVVIKDMQDRLGELHDCDVWVEKLKGRMMDDTGLDVLMHDRMDARTSKYEEFVKEWETLIEEGFFDDLLNSIVPDAVLTITPAVGLTKLERIKAVAGNCGADMEHSIHVAELSLMLFDGLHSLHDMKETDRDLLEYASVLHDIGWKNGRKDHHKTSLQMILADDRLPFYGGERAIVANVARYHRGVMPNDKHKAYGVLGAADRSKVDRLASIMRLADALDVSHASVVRSAECHIKKGNVMIILKTKGSPDRELDKLGKKKDLFERTFKRTLTVEWDGS